MKINNLAVIQVRTSSKRLPNKCMLPLGGVPLIGFMIDRVKHSSYIDKLIIATTTLASDNKLTEYINSKGIEVFRGSENNVLERIYLASLKFNPKTIIRLTGDCPLLDHKIIDNLIKFFYKMKADYSWIDESFAEGLDAEIFKFSVLKECNENAIYKSEREHVTQYIHKNEKKFKRIPFKNKVDDSNLRIVVDEKPDYKLVSFIVNHFQSKAKNNLFTFEEIKKYLLNNKELTEINSNIIRNEGLQRSLAADDIY